MLFSLTGCGYITSVRERKIETKALTRKLTCASNDNEGGLNKYYEFSFDEMMEQISEE